MGWMKGEYVTNGESMNAFSDFSDMTHMLDEARIERVVLAKRVGQLLASGDAGSETAMLETVARNLCHDEMELVRGALSFELRHCDQMAEDVVKAIVFDEEDVAVPFLQNSQAISDALLKDVIEAKPGPFQIAIARRISISEPVTDCLAEKAVERAVQSLARNPGAVFGEKAVELVSTRFSDRPLILGDLVQRPDISKKSLEKLGQKIGVPQGSKKKTGPATVPFAVLLAQLRLAHRLGDLGPQKIAEIVDAQGKDGLEAVLMAILDRPRNKITKLLYSDAQNARSALFRRAKFSSELEQHILEKLGSRWS